MILNPIRRAYERGRSDERQRNVAQLRAQAALHVGLSGDAHRRKALNSAADAIRDDRGVGRRRG